MAFDPTEYDDVGQWTGTCEACDTNHDGYPPDTLGAQMRCLHNRVATLGPALGGARLAAKLDAAQRDLQLRRDDTLRALGLIP